MKRTHLITIVLIAIVFMVLRFSGGKVTFDSGEDANSNSDNSNELVMENRDEIEEELPSENREQIKRKLVNDVLDSEVQEEEEKKENIGDKLEDVEKAMGLR